MTGPADEDRQRPALTILDVMTLVPTEVYGVVTLLAASQDPAVQRALSDAVTRVMVRTRPRDGLGS